jgi:hypothetical protein
VAAINVPEVVPCQLVPPVAEWHRRELPVVKLVSLVLPVAELVNVSPATVMMMMMIIIIKIVTTRKRKSPNATFLLGQPVEECHPLDRPVVVSVEEWLAKRKTINNSIQFKRRQLSTNKFIILVCFYTRSKGRQRRIKKKKEKNENGSGILPYVRYNWSQKNPTKTTMLLVSQSFLPLQTMDCQRHESINNDMGVLFCTATPGCEWHIP